MGEAQFKRKETAKACVFHLPPLVLYLYPDGLEFGGWRRRLLFCHWLKAVNLIKQKKYRQKQTQELAAGIHISRPGVLHTHTQHADITRQLEGHLRRGARLLLGSASA